ncbi:MAG: type II toxin-antitoxin system VapC family toxin [Dichotomicrobium sp.]
MLVIDASVAARWFVPSLAWPGAKAILESGESFIAPEIILVEVANAFWKAVRADYMTSQEMATAIGHLPSLFTDLVPVRELVSDAGDLAVTLDHPVYDRCYIALARRVEALLVTADKRLAQPAQRVSGLEVRLIG